MTNIIVITQSKFNKRDYERFGIEFFINAGFNVIVFDLSNFLRDSFYINNYFPSDSYEGNEVISLSTISEIDCQLNFLKGNSYALCFINLYNIEAPIIKLLTKYKIKYCQFIINVTPDVRSFLRRKASYLFYIFKQNIINYSLNAPDLLFYAGKESLNKLGYKRSFLTKTIEIPSSDFRIAFSEKVKNHDNTYADIVFIDQFWPYHPDFGEDKFLDSKKYHQKINTFFNKISIQFNMSLGVISHPRSNYKTNPFDFPILKGKTSEIIKKAKLVLAQHSTAISYAVVFKIPILILSFNEINNHFSGKLSVKKSKILGTNIIYLDEDYLINNDFPKSNTNFYEKYIKNYMYSQNNNEYIDWEFYLSNYIKSIFQDE